MSFSPSAACPNSCGWNLIRDFCKMRWIPDATEQSIQKQRALKTRVWHIIRNKKSLQSRQRSHLQPLLNRRKVNRYQILYYVMQKKTERRERKQWLYLRKKSFFARFLAHNTGSKTKTFIIIFLVIKTVHSVHLCKLHFHYYTTLKNKNKWWLKQDNVKV